MPIRIPDALPATGILESENIFVMTENRAMHQDIRPLYVAILNLMPTKVVTETQLMRKLSNTPLQVEIDLMRMSTHVAKNASTNHLKNFYTTFEEIKDNRYDGLIITGAPVEAMRFEDVDYWDEFTTIMDWSRTHVYSVFHICWGAQAGMYYHYGINKHELDEKCFGVFSQSILKPTSPLVRGFNDVSYCPHSRHTEVLREDIEQQPLLEIIAYSDEAGVSIVKSTDSKDFFVMGHPEYDKDTLKLEYERDLESGKSITIPKNYFPNDDPHTEPLMQWQAEAQLLYSNWLNYYVYQTTPYDLSTL